MDFYEALWTDMRPGIENLVARRRNRRRRAVIATTIAGLALTVAGVALATSRLLGSPAPPQVKTEIASVDRGMPADLRLNPDVENAHAVAVTESSTLYAAALRDGGHCTEIVTGDGRGRGAVCHTAAETVATPIELTLPSDDPGAVSAPVTIAGHVNVPAVRVAIAYGSFAHDVRLGQDGYFLFDVPASELGSAHRSEIVVTARTAQGAVAARAKVPADWDAPAVSDERQPLFVSTRSNETDLTKVYGIEGHVGADGAARLELRYDDGETVLIPLEQDGSYSYTVPDDHVGRFMRPQLLVARDARGAIVARAHVAAVAYWRDAERHP